MALLAVQGLAMSATAALPSHHHGAVSASFCTSSYALGAVAASPRARSNSLATAALSAPLAPVLQVYCGRGDKKTKRGKRFNHSYGNVSPRELAHRGSTLLQRLQGRISLMTGRSFQLKSMRISWNRLFELCSVLWFLRA
ncbi:unnamed protein product [Urochloa humidicola]